jgi:hypothetical protein
MGSVGLGLGHLPRAAFEHLLLLVFMAYEAPSEMNLPRKRKKASGRRDPFHLEKTGTFDITRETTTGRNCRGIPGEQKGKNGDIGRYSGNKLGKGQGKNGHIRRYSGNKEGAE